TRVHGRCVGPRTMFVRSQPCGPVVVGSGCGGKPHGCSSQTEPDPTHPGSDGRSLKGGVGRSRRVEHLDRRARPTPPVRAAVHCWLLPQSPRANALCENERLSRAAVLRCSTRRSRPNPPKGKALRPGVWGAKVPFAKPLAKRAQQTWFFATQTDR